MANTGNVIVTERDMNPLSPTYDTTRTRTYQDLERCVPYTEPTWTEQSSECEVADGYNTGYLIVVELDTNQHSATYNTTRTRYVFDIGQCQLSTGFKAIKIYGVDHSDIAVVECNSNNSLTSQEIEPVYNQNSVFMRSLVIGECVTSIYFAACQGLYITEVYIPSSVISVGGRAFFGCRYFENVVLPSVRRIEDYAFMECDNLRNIDLGDSLAELGDGVFKDCYKLDNVVLPSTVTTIREHVFYGCSALKSLTCLSTTPPTLSVDDHGRASLFGATDRHSAPSGYYIYVPAEALNAYKTASGWSNYASRIQAIPT